MYIVLRNERSTVAHFGRVPAWGAVVMDEDVYRRKSNVLASTAGKEKKKEM